MPFKSDKPDFAVQFDWSPSPLARAAMLDWILDNVVVSPNGCYLWAGSDSGSEGRGSGYPKLKLPHSRKTAYVHRVVYEVMVGPIPQGYQIDHKCKHWDRSLPPEFALIYRRCINWEHLEPVTQSDNLKRNHFKCL